MQEAVTKEKRKRELERRKAIECPCPTCGARPREWCMTENRERTALHQARIRQAGFKAVPA
jgi:hypothetical protein